MKKTIIITIISFIIIVGILFDLGIIKIPFQKSEPLSDSERIKYLEGKL